MDTSIYYELPGAACAEKYMEMGDSIVWQCTNQYEFQNIILPYTILNNKRCLIKYLSFSNQTTFPVNKNEVMTYYINADEGFESLTYQVYYIIDSSPANTIFLFDFLSELQTSWVSDMMMANFFRIICPILAEVKSSGFFPILRNQHSYRAIQSIMKNADIFMDIQKQKDYIRIQLIHLQSEHHIKNRIFYYQLQQQPILFTKKEKPDIEFTEDVINKKGLDIWNRYFTSLKTLSETNIFSKEESQKICHRLMTQEEKMKALIVQHFSLGDYLSISELLIGTGKIGGKACGFLLGRKLIEQYVPDSSNYIEPCDTYFIGTDVFYSYMVENDCWSLRLKHRLKQETFNEIDNLKEALLHGAFPSSIRKQFCKMLLYYEDTPIIIRSSSFLEDGYGNAFSGKYESIFCSNQGTLKERLYELEQAIRSVYISTLSPSALEYRKVRGLLGQDEQMALLVQKVAGSRYGDLYFPLAAGVSFSYNPYRWMEQINPEAGMVRIVAGLGTRAVNRTPGDYPRLIGLDRPQAMLWATTKDRHKFSQRYMDVFRLSTGKVEAKPCEDIISLLPLNQQRLVFSHDTEAEDFLQQQGRFRSVFFTDCQGIVNNLPYISFMKSILSMLEQKYETPVDIEFSLTAREYGTIGINLLQCRPLQGHKSQAVTIQTHRDSDVLFEIKQASMRGSKEETINLVVIVDPKNYYETPYNTKTSIASIIGKINQQIKDKNALLLVPGRIGTSSPELGVPVNYTEVSQFKAICEVAYSLAGYNPELSYGSHMFQDLVEADVFYAAINENHNTKLYRPEILSDYHDLYDQMFPDHPEYHPVIQIYDLADQPAVLYLDAARGHALCMIQKISDLAIIPR